MTACMKSLGALKSLGGLWDQAHDYLSRETMRVTKVQFRIGAFLNCVPFELEGRDNLRVRMFPSWWRRAVWHLFSMVYYFHTLFLLVTCGIALVSKPFDNEVTLHLVYTTFAMYGFVFMLSLHLKPKECVFMLNQHDFLLKAVADMRMKIPDWTSHYFVIIAVYYFSFVRLGVWCMQATMFMWKPRSPQFIYYYLPGEWQNPWTFLLVLTYELAWTSWYLTLFGVFFCYWCAHIFTINSITAELMTKTYTKAKDAKLYEYLQLFTTVFNDFNGSLFTTGFNFMLILTPVIFIYLSLTTYASVHLVVYLVLPTFAAFGIGLILSLLPQDSKVGTVSADLVKALRSRQIKDQWGVEGERTSVHAIESVMAADRSRRLLKMRARAYAPLGIRIWFFGIYTLGTSQEMIDQLFNNVLLLLSL